MTDIKIHDLKSSDVESADLFVDLTDTEMEKVNGGFRKLFLRAQQNSRSNSGGGSSGLSNGLTDLQLQKAIEDASLQQTKAILDRASAIKTLV
jgi:hypothetical protein